MATPTHPHEHSMVKSRPLQFGAVGGMGVKKPFVWHHPFVETGTWDTQFCDFPTNFMFLMCLKLPRGAWSRLGFSGGWWPWTLFRDIENHFLCGPHDLFNFTFQLPEFYGGPYQISCFKKMINMQFKILVNKKSTSTTNLACIWRGCIHAIALARCLLYIM
jgi:hypothetical protein